MEKPTVGVFVVAAAVAGALVGFEVGRSTGPTVSSSSKQQPQPTSAVSSSGRSPRASRDGLSSVGTDRSDRGSRRRSVPRRPAWNDDDKSGRPPNPRNETADEGAFDLNDPQRLSRDLRACLEERVELLGTPIEMPGEPEDRFASRSVSTGTRDAMDQAGVAGEVEATDCSEHPCIVFGRLEGDEEDMEKIERADALAPYESDILSLLFWATSVDDPSAPAHETGLFALAFYTDADRQELGDALDRRIRARVMEYWNTDKPGRAAGL